MRLTSVLMGAVAVLAFAGCPGPGGGGGSGGGFVTGGGTGNGGGAGNGGGNGAGATGPWTVFVYLVADNDLEPFALADLAEMAAVGSTSDLRIVVQVDRSADYSSDGILNLGNWTSTKRLLVEKGRFTELGDLGELNMADPTTLRDFIAWGLQNYPADRTALVLWDHGGGSLQGFGVDEQAQAIMSVPAIQQGVGDGLRQAGRTRFDFIGFDACLMASFEVAESLKSYASYLVASEETEPGHGWDYRAFAGVTRSMSTTAVAQKVADGFKAQAQDPMWKDDARITLSVIDLSKLGPIETALTALATSYGTPTTIAPVVTPLGQARNGSVQFGDNPDPARALNLIDLGDLSGRASAITGVAAVQAAVSGAVVYQVTGAATANARGLSIYFPPTSTSYSATYDRISTLPGVTGVTEWKTVLQAYFGSGASAVAPLFDYTTSGINTTHDALTISGDVTSATQAGLSDAFMAYGVRTGAGAVLLGEIEAGLTGATVTGSWDWTFLKLVQGTYFEFGYLSLRSLNSTTGIATIPLVYDSGGQQRDAIRALVFDLAAGTLKSDTTYVSNNGAFGELSAQPGAKLRARVAFLADFKSYQPQWVLYDPTAAGFDATAPVTIQFADVAVGAEAFAGVRIENSAHVGGWLYSDPLPVRP
jgi:Clostripain family